MSYQYKIVLAGMVAVGIAFVTVFEGGYLIHARYPDVPDDVFAGPRKERLKQIKAESAREYAAFLKYADLVERGEEYLRAIERGMRLGGAMPKLIALLSVKADCCINQPGLKNRFTLPECVHYEEGYEPERSANDNPWAKLSCSQCASTRHRQ
jgi:hypothetical protein